jgi:hypothetical protein
MDSGAPYFRQTHIVLKVSLCIFPQQMVHLQCSCLFLNDIALRVDVTIFAGQHFHLHFLMLIVLLLHE